MILFVSTVTGTARTSPTPSRASAGVFLVSTFCQRISELWGLLQLLKPTGSALVWFWCAKAADSDSLVVYVLSWAVLSALRDH